MPQLKVYSLMACSVVVVAQGSFLPDHAAPIAQHKCLPQSSNQSTLAKAECATHPAATWVRATTLLQTSPFRTSRPRDGSRLSKVARAVGKGHDDVPTPDLGMALGVWMTSSSWPTTGARRTTTSRPIATAQQARMGVPMASTACKLADKLLAEFSAFKPRKASR